MIKIHGTVASYLIGFLLSIVLTLLAYDVVTSHISSSFGIQPNIIILFLIFLLALTQLFVQLLFFIHLGQESAPKWNLLFFIFTLTTIIVIIAGSIWIMSHLNYNMTPKQTMQYINDQSGI